MAIVAGENSSFASMNVTMTGSLDIYINNRCWLVHGKAENYKTEVRSSVCVLRKEVGSVKPLCFEGTVHLFLFRASITAV